MNTTNDNDTPRDNYRIYDGTGGGCKKDIYATSLEDAIEKGKEWMLGGAWGEYIGSLDYSISEIIYDEDGDIDKDATEYADRHDCSVEYAPQVDECPEEEAEWCVLHRDDRDEYNGIDEWMPISYHPDRYAAELAVQREFHEFREHNPGNSYGPEWVVGKKVDEKEWEIAD